MMNTTVDTADTAVIGSRNSAAMDDSTATIEAESRDFAATHQQAGAVSSEPNLEVDPVCPQVDVVLVAQVPLFPSLALLSPGVLEPGDVRRG